MRAHTDRQYEEELNQLKDHILKMGGVVESMLASALRALMERNAILGQEVFRQEPTVNHLEMTIDNLCLQLLALRQPAASDLRFITIGLRTSKDLERMGDLAVNIAEHAVELNKELQLKPYVDLPLMGGKAQRMVKSALDAFVKRDAVLAKQVCEVDDEVDTLNRQIFRELVESMQKDSGTVARATQLVLVITNLERIADHATNIAEEVIFMVQGKDIRHGKEQPM